MPGFSPHSSPQSTPFNDKTPNTPSRIMVARQALREPLSKEQAALFDSCQGLVRSLAWRIQSKMGKLVELDDLIAYGQLGLVEAARKFDPGRGMAFTTYAHYRIRGAILDGLEKLRWFNKAAFRGSRYEHLATDFLVSDNPSEQNDGTWLVQTSRSLAVSYLLSSDAVAAAAAAIEDDSNAAPDAGLMSEELRVMVHKAIEQLPPQVALLIRWTYFEGLNLKEAGERLGISKAWASRLHARALSMLAGKLKQVGYEQ